ncbi:protein PIGBOS1 [Choloepus didactylus]|uniref:protein PIGBOS1 n=1 Tax=Choloepus didactylus TaxID=27675 RepID=UPI0018A0DF54|nr:protein PIGBOS1 [Choloepus didactylus]
MLLNFPAGSLAFPCNISFTQDCCPTLACVCVRKFENSRKEPDLTSVGADLKRFPGCGNIASTCIVLNLLKTMFRRLTLPQLLFASILGVAGGMYIYQPVFEQYSKDQKALKEKLKLAQELEEKKS